MENENTNIPEGKEVKAKLDTILEKHFRKLDQINVLGDKIPLNVASIATLHLIVEKESEIEESSGSDQRYTRKSCLNDLTELGMEIDDDLMTSFQGLSDQGYIDIDSEGQYHAKPVTVEIVNNFNKMFPGMPGMNLVAYVIQTVDEILSGRKDYEKGIEQFDQALSSRGRPLTFVHLRTERKTEKQKAEERIKRAKEREESRKASNKLKKVYSEKLKHLRRTVLETSEEPLVVTKRVIGSDEINIKEISPRKLKEAKEKEEKERLERERIEREKLEEERKKLEEERMELERIAKEREEEERLERERLEKEEQERLEREAEEKLRLEREKEEQLRLENERKEQERLEQERVEQERLEKESSKKLSVEEQIAAFEKEMGTPCPVCHQGKIVQDVTESGKTYFKCSSEGCRFISWDKPYNYQCPICMNSYLMEFRAPDGNPGLKCPKATCSYIQSNLDNPSLHIPPQQPGMPLGGTQPLPQGGIVPPPKKKRLVRRKKR